MVLVLCLALLAIVAPGHALEAFVSVNGTDSPGCMDAMLPCRTIRGAFNALSQFSAPGYIIFVGEGLFELSSEGGALLGDVLVAGSGINGTTLACQEAEGTGFSPAAGSSFRLENVTFEGSMCARGISSGNDGVVYAAVNVRFRNGFSRVVLGNETALNATVVQCSFTDVDGAVAVVSGSFVANHSIARRVTSLLRVVDHPSAAHMTPPRSIIFWRFRAYDCRAGDEPLILDATSVNQTSNRWWLRMSSFRRNRAAILSVGPSEYINVGWNCFTEHEARVISVLSPADLHVVGNLFRNNSGGAVEVRDFANLDLQYNNFVRNSVQGNGAGLLAESSRDDSHMYMSGCAFAGNTASMHGGGVFLSVNSSGGAPVGSLNGTLAILSNVDLLNNTAGGAAGGVYLQLQGVCLALSSIVVDGNRAGALASSLALQQLPGRFSNVTLFSRVSVLRHEQETLPAILASSIDGVTPLIVQTIRSEQVLESRCNRGDIISCASPSVSWSTLSLGNVTGVSCVPGCDVIINGRNVCGSAPSELVCVTPQYFQSFANLPEACPVVPDPIHFVSGTIFGTLTLSADNSTILDITLEPGANIVVASGQAYLAGVLTIVTNGDTGSIPVLEGNYAGAFSNVTVLDLSGGSSLEDCESFLGTPTYSTSGVSVSVTIDRSKCGLPLGAIIGIGVGALVVAVLVVAIPLGIASRRTKERFEKDLQRIESGQTSQN